MSARRGPRAWEMLGYQAVAGQCATGQDLIEHSNMHLPVIQLLCPVL